MKIEHWLDRRDHEERMYDWTNLLGVCGGEYEDANGRVEHCDKAKGNADLALHPATGTAPRPEDVLEFKRRPPDGEDPPFQGVWVHGTTDGAKQDIATLNLNADHLVRNRRAAVDAVDKQLRRTNNPARNRRVLRKILAEVTADAGELPVFSRMVAEHVRRKLRRYEGSP